MTSLQDKSPLKFTWVQLYHQHFVSMVKSVTEQIKTFHIISAFEENQLSFNLWN